MEKSQKYLRDLYYSGMSKGKSMSDRLLMLKHSRLARKTKKSIQNTMEGMGQEAKETKDMANSFFKLLHSKLDLTNRTEPPSKEEVKAAIEQLKDVGRVSVFASISILPAGGFSLIGLEMLARKFGINNFTFVPSAFRRQDAGSKQKETSKDEEMQ